MRNPPSKGMCLWLAQMYWERKPQRAADRETSWHYLLCWAAYDDWVELY